jgi:UDP-N-acetyl-D-glucosamine dehydrogenase
MSTHTAIALTVQEQLENRIQNHTAAVGVVGLGYVGLPLAVEFAKAGFPVTGIDVSRSKVARIQCGDSYVLDVPSPELRSLTEAGRMRATTDFSVLSELDTVNICVPTPLRKSKDPDMSYIKDAAERIAEHIHPGMLIILESTTYPGTTEEFILPMLERRSLQVGKDFFLCFSPERVDPGNERFGTANIPKVVGGVTAECTRMGSLFYRQALAQVVPVTSSRVAEMVKLLENTFRMINIGLVNEMAVLCNRMSIDVWEVIEAAATKPFGFMPFYPGPGLGGHCIPIDPFYLAWKTRQAGLEARFIELAGYVNAQMPHFVIDKVQTALNEVGRPVRGSRIHIFGVAYKRDIDDLRESPALDIIHLLQQRHADVSYSDPLISTISVDGIHLTSVPEESAADSDIAVIVTDHSAFDYQSLLSRAPLIVDTRNALRSFSSPKIIRL